MPTKYYITAIGRTGTNIDRFAVHTLEQSGALSIPTYMTEDEVIAKTASTEKATFYTAIWNYVSKSWQFSTEMVAPVRNNTHLNIRSGQDGIAKNNLSNLPVLNF